MELQKFSKENKKKKIIIAAIAVVGIALIGITLFRSYALFEEEKTFNVLKGKVGNFVSGDVQLSYTINGKSSSSAFPSKSSGYTATGVTCENGVTASWDSTDWGLINVNSNNNSKIKCNVDFSHIICKRATTLHTKSCVGGSTCSISGMYISGATITYGSLGTSGTLTSGDAFDCDVNGDGNYDSATERFYYVSDYYDTKTKSFDTNYATLVYYENMGSNVVWGSVNYVGPDTAKTQLPTTSEWSNVSLKDTTRDILQYNSSTVVSGYSYSGYAARLLTYQEIEEGCYDETTNVSANGGIASKCLFLLENTKFDYVSNSTSGHWIESVITSGTTVGFAIYEADGNIEYTPGINTVTDYGVRPAIDVSKSSIAYK